MAEQDDADEGDDEGWNYTVDDSLGDLVDIGDNFAIPAEEGNDEEVDFYILQCQRRKYVVMEQFCCVWGAVFQVGQAAIVGTYYQKSG